jgi:undecaprenyl phosphate-alpha-L-ara4N flippase subunit ArnE
VTLSLLGLILLSQAALVAGQVFLKHGMTATTGGAGGGRTARSVMAGIAMLTLWFFVWMGLLQKLDLSYVYPFEGLSPILLVLAARVILHETLTWQAGLGVFLITLGTLLVGLS